jgi:uncharacterized membrane protein
MSAFTIFHTVVSLLAIIAGIVVAYGLITGRRYERSTLAYFITTIVTLVTCFRITVLRRRSASVFSAC